MNCKYSIGLHLKDVFFKDRKVLMARKISKVSSIVFQISRCTSQFEEIYIFFIIENTRKYFQISQRCLSIEPIFEKNTYLTQ